MSEDFETPGQRNSRRTAVIWLLIVLCFVPAVVVRMLPGGWQELHPAAQWITIGFGAACTLAVCFLIMRSPGDDA